jgi:hypothetical protein
VVLGRSELSLEARTSALPSSLRKYAERGGEPLFSSEKVFVDAQHSRAAERVPLAELPF